MGIISKLYIKNFVCRYDKEVGVPYYSYQDFKGLHQETFRFVNRRGINIHCFYYYYDNFRADKTILFCHGLGPGHTAYLAEIETLAKRGYKILTLDYQGCDESEGKNMRSVNAPTSDVIDLLNYLKPKEEIVLIGHSLGGYTALNVLNLRKEITKAVILSGFISMKEEMLALIKSKFLVSGILRYEKKQEPQYFSIDLVEYLKNTKDDIFFIQSDDDTMVPYNTALKVVEEIDNSHIRTLRMSGRKHNPNYTDAAVNYMNEVFGNYNYLLKNKKIKTDKDKIAFFKDVSLPRLVEQDEELFDQIEAFIK